MADGAREEWRHQDHEDTAGLVFRGGDTEATKFQCQTKYNGIEALRFRKSRT